VGAALLFGGVVTPLVATGPGAGAAVGPTATTTTVVPYSCAGVGFASYLGTLPTQNVTVTMTAPTEVTVGQAFTVTADITPLALVEPPLALNVQANMPFNPVGATGSNGGAGLSGTVNAVGATFNVPQFTMTATPTVTSGAITFSAGNIGIVQGATGFACSKMPGATATISTNVVGSLTTSSTSSTTTTTTIPGQTTTTADPNVPTSTTTTTAAPTTTTTTAPPATSTTVPPTVVTTTAPPPTAPPTPTGTAASIISRSATATFSCNIYDDTGKQFNQNPLPDSSVTVTLTIPDKVGVGGTVSGLVKMDPGPLNGPIALKAGTVNYAVTLLVAGGSPATVTATGGPNGSQIAPNVPSVSPNMAFSVTTSAGAGGEVGIGVKQVEVQASSPTKLTTRCTPSGSGMARVGATSVVAGAVVAPAQISRSASSASASSSRSSGVSSSGTSSDGGYANCAAAKADGRGTIVKTDPAYRARLDGDNDGLACETGDPVVLGASLARSGTSTAPLLAGSFGAVAIGAVLLVVSRRRRVEENLTA